MRWEGSGVALLGVLGTGLVVAGLNTTALLVLRRRAARGVPVYPGQLLLIAVDLATVLLSYPNAFALDIFRLSRAHAVCHSDVAFAGVYGSLPLILGALLVSQLVQIGVCADRCQGIQKPMLYRTVNMKKRMVRLGILTTLLSYTLFFLCFIPSRKLSEFCADPLHKPEQAICLHPCNKAAIMGMRDYRLGASGELEIPENQATWRLLFSRHSFRESCCSVSYEPLREAFMGLVAICTFVAQTAAGAYLATLFRAQNKAAAKWRKKAAERRRAVAERSIVLMVLVETGVQVLQTAFLITTRVAMGMGLDSLVPLFTGITYACSFGQMTCSFFFPLLMSPSYRADLVQWLRRK